MIITETVMIDGDEMTHTYSDENRYVVRDGIAYEDALDPAEYGRTYTEGDPIIAREPDEGDYEEVGKIMMGVL